MAILKSKDIIKMNEKEMNSKIDELKIELIKARINVKKGGGAKSNIREIKRTIAKLLTFKNKIKYAPVKEAVKGAKK
jgi:ribosomal protein L29